MTYTKENLATQQAAYIALEIEERRLQLGLDADDDRDAYERTVRERIACEIWLERYEVMAVEAVHCGVSL